MSAVITACREELQNAQYEAAKANLVPCRNCSRRFAPDRVGVHERICKGPKKPPPHGACRQNADADDRDAGRWATPAASKVHRYFFIMALCNTLLMQ